MAQSKEKSKDNLRIEYIRLVKKGIHIQQKGDINAYTINALQAENVAQKLQSLAKGH
ncbi:MAG: hypothetical protein KAI29_21280 [Cyclobacteriaceae bacterium]|nr:hypothetical protein [Cyclobacteriaceae bacterium]